VLELVIVGCLVAFYIIIPPKSITVYLAEDRLVSASLAKDALDAISSF